ncbi:winged helix-turn-helix domain-containing protein [Mesorhizobium sp. YC-39]|uniref:ATP-binding protein n=1 Tax=unclassified Mesorhizobium TaxID=325217 RepID=UPI0021E7CAFF|nr:MULTISPECIES: winged helix-turn-helix domain-containing protein [unclassified Mesorhizobium]MCV3206531.1 winged helix-turn-helix domain-containing protein [Mesorhizobium sp. YC-2]MCV3227069.1 winged helix-turn-helix domain-containing protein [Mesorhizobium sp. YC-39]
MTRDGVPVAVGGRALDILIALTDRATEIVSGRDLIDTVWRGVTVEEANLRVHIAALRKVLGDGRDGKRYLITVHGRGYTFVAPLGYQASRSPTEVDLALQPPRLRTLPAPLRSMAGRDETVRDLASRVSSDRLLSIVGPGGIGKTTVAVAVAHSLLQSFGAESVFFVDLGSVDHKADVASAIATAIDCPMHGLSPEPAILDFLAEKHALVVLDSCEHVLETVAPLAARILGTTPSVHLLTTSREALRIEIENVHLLRPLDWPMEDFPSAATALRSSAVKLFMDRAASSGHWDNLSDADAPVVVDICRRLDGIALAIELVASRVGTYGILGVADLLKHPNALQLPGRRSSLPRHQTLHAMLDWSFNLLSPSERETLFTLSIFVGQFPLEAAYSVAGVAPHERQGFAAAISSLVDKSLITISSTSGPVYYRLLDTTRAYASGILEETDEVAAIASRHASHFCAFLKSFVADRQGFDGREAAQYAPHLGNIRKALSWSFSDNGEPLVAHELAAYAAPLLLGLSQFDECQRWCRQALAGLTDREIGTLRELQLLHALSRSAIYAPTDFNEAKATFERGLQLSKDLHDERRHFDLLADFNVFLVRHGDFKGAMATAKESAAVASSTGDAAQRVLSEWMLGASYHAAGDQAAALKHCRSGFRLHATSGPLQLDLACEARARFGLTRSLWLQGFPDQALESAYLTMSHMAKYSHHASYCFALVWTIPVLIWCGETDAAVEPIEVALAHSAKYSLASFHAIAKAQKAELVLTKGNDRHALEMLSDVHAAMLASQTYSIIASSTSCVFAKALANAGRSGEAVSIMEAALARAEQVDEQCWRPELLRTQGEVALLAPEPNKIEAERFLVQSVECARSQGALAWALKAAIPLAHLWRATGRTAEAQSLLAGVYGQFTEGFQTQDLIASRALLCALGSASRMRARTT